MARSNCVIQAVREYRRLRREWELHGRKPWGEPYLWVRASRLGPDWLPHVGVGYRSSDGSMTMRSCRPADTSPLPWWRAWRAWRFEGEWVDGDD